jgi:hypothetical protein
MFVYCYSVCVGGVQVLNQAKQCRWGKVGKLALEIGPGRFYLYFIGSSVTLFTLDGPKSRIVSLMQIDAALQLVIFDNRPTPAANQIVFILSEPGELKT